MNDFRILYFGVTKLQYVENHLKLY